MALAPFAENIIWAFIFGSVASGKESSAGDIDLMIIGEVGYAKVVGTFHAVQETLGREVNPKIYSKDEWMHTLNNKDAFSKELFAKPRMDVMGNADGLK